MMKTDFSSPTTEPDDDIQATMVLQTTRPGGLSRILVSIVLVLGIIGVGTAIFVFLLSTVPPARHTTNTTLPPLVDVQTLIPETIQQTFVGYGSARSDREVLISAEASGQIMQVPPDVKDGSHVTKGQVLVRIDDRSYLRKIDKALGELADVEAQLDRLDVESSNIQGLIDIAQKEVNIAQAEYKRLDVLHEKNLASKKEWDFAHLDYQTRNRVLLGLKNQLQLIPNRKAVLKARSISHEADVQLARLECEHCTIKAPFSGQIEDIMVEAGDRVRLGSEIIRVVDTRFIEIPIELPMSARSRIKPRTSCVLTLDSMPGVHWEATIKRFSPMADTRSRTFTAYVEVDNQKQSTPLIPGYFVIARVNGPILRDALAIPRGAILRDRVLVVLDGKAHFRHIQVRSLLKDRAVVTGEIAAADRVILTNLDILSEGMPVRWQEAVAGSGRSNAEVSIGITPQRAPEKSQ